MKVNTIWNMVNGWIVGGFEPSMYNNPHVEVAHQSHSRGRVGESHTHHHSTELTYIVSGRLIASGKMLFAGDMFEYAPYEVSNVRFLEDTDLVVIKWPSVPNDKHLVDE